MHTAALAQDGSIIANTKTAGQHVSIDNPFYGLWEVVKVTVGPELITPHAKWFDIKADGTSTSGNGWLQNSKGTWAFNELSKEILFSADGIPDSFGAFVLSYEKNLMTWRRMEDGQEVAVILKRTDKKPKALWDKIVGTWQGIDMGNSSRDVRFGWTKRFVDTNDDIQMFGIWHIDAHKPILTLFYDREERHVWNVKIDGDNMIWTQEKDNKSVIFTFVKSPDPDK